MPTTEEGRFQPLPGRLKGGRQDRGAEGPAPTLAHSTQRWPQGKSPVVSTVTEATSPPGREGESFCLTSPQTPAGCRELFGMLAAEQGRATGLWPSVCVCPHPCLLSVCGYLCGGSGSSLFAELKKPPGTRPHPMSAHFCSPETRTRLQTQASFRAHRPPLPLSSPSPPPPPWASRLPHPDGDRIAQQVTNSVAAILDK